MVQTSEMRAGISPPLAGSESARAWLGSGLADLQSGRARFALGFDDAVVFFGRRLIVNVDPARLEYQLENEVTDGDRTYAVPDFFVGNGDWSPWLKSLSGNARSEGGAPTRPAGIPFSPDPCLQDAAGKNSNAKVCHPESCADRQPGKARRLFSQLLPDVPPGWENGHPRDAGSRIEGDESFTTGNSARPVWAEYTERNIGIAIGSRGELYRVGPGQHRTAVAKTLNLAKMPCEVRLLHVDWIERQLWHSRQPLPRALKMAVVTACQATG